MTRPHLTDPATNEEWDALPQEFFDFMDQVDNARAQLSQKEPKDSYEYTWEVDDKAPFEAILNCWNTPGELEDPFAIAKGIQEGLCDEALIAWGLDYFSP